MAGNLFYMPRQIAQDYSNSSHALAGAKLHFTQTGTSTDQNTYTDVALATPHANPVIADSDGEFAPIYFDPALGDYRVQLVDSSDVSIWIEDDIPASQSGQSLTLKAAAPFIDLIESDAAANNTSWRFGVNSEQLTLQVANDALAAFTNVLTVDRTANTVDTVDLLPTTLNHNGLPLGVSKGAFTATWAGFTTSPTTTWNYTRVGNVVVLHPDGTLSATSNTTGLTSGATDVIAALRPTETTVNTLYRVTDNGTTAAGVISISNAGQISFQATIATSAFTASGTKGFVGSQIFTYLLD